MEKQQNYLFFQNVKVIYVLLTICLGISSSLVSQTIVYSNDFNVAENPLGSGNAGSPAMTWNTTSTSTGGSRTAQLGSTGNYLLQIKNDFITPILAGKTYVSGQLSNFNNSFKGTLKSNLSDIIWTFNIRSGRNSASTGFDSNQYASAVVLCSENSNFLTSNGYAVTLMKGVSYNAVRLVKFTGGLSSNSNVSTIIGPSTPESSSSYTDYFSVKVIYSPVTNKWKLFTRMDGTSVSVNPESGTLTQIGTEIVDMTYTNVEMSSFGFFYNHGTTSYYPTYFDNFKVKLNNAQAISANSTLSDLGLTETQLSNTDFRINSGEFILDQNVALNSVLVAPGAKLTLNSGNTLTSANGITLQSNNSGTATFVDNNNTSPQVISGTVEQYLSSARNWYLSSPIEGATIPAGQTYYSYDETGSNVGFTAPATAYWVAVPEGTAINPVKGYIARPGAAVTRSYTGTFNTGTKTATLTRTNSASNPGFNLVANPYPSYLDWSRVDTTAAQILSSVWYRTKTSGGAYTFDTYNGGLQVATTNGENTVTKLIPPMQAFWVRVKPGYAGGTLTFDNTMRKHVDNAANKFKTKENVDTKLIRIRISDGTISDETLVCQHPNAMNGYDSYDSPKMFNNVASQPELYSIAGTEKLVINGLREISCDQEIKLGLTYLQGGNLSIKLTELSDFDSNTKVYLLDKQENTETELTTESEYSFSTEAVTNNENRFSLLFRTPEVTTAVANQNKESIPIFVNTQNQITIIAGANSKYSIYNAIGQLIETGFILSNYQTSNFKASTGMYIVKVNNQSTRVIVP